MSIKHEPRFSRYENFDGNSFGDRQSFGTHEPAALALRSHRSAGRHAGTAPCGHCKRRHLFEGVGCVRLNGLMKAILRQRQTRRRGITNVTAGIRDYTDWADVVERRLKGLGRLDMLQTGIICCERILNVWAEFDPTESRIYAALDSLKNFKLEQLKSQDLLARKEIVLSCNGKAADAEMNWDGDPNNTRGVIAFRANMAAASLSNLYWAVIKEEHPETAVGFCIGLAWAASNYDPNEMLFQDELIRKVCCEKLR